MRLFFPTSVEEALKIKKETNGSFISGGTIIMVDRLREKNKQENFIALERIEELHEIKENEHTVEIGSSCTFSQIIKCEAVKKYCYALYQASSQIGGPQIRNRATIGGNYASNSPASDAIAPIIVLQPEIIKKDDLIVKFIFKKDIKLKSCFFKVGRRSALAVSSLSMAISFKEPIVRVAVGSCASQVIYCEKTSQFLSNGHLIEEAKDVLMTEISPIDDRWASSEYRKDVCRNLLEKLYSEVIR